MIADLHCHYPMHLLVDEDEAEAHPRKALNELIKKPNERDGLGPKLLAWVTLLFARLLNFPRFWGNWRVKLEGLETAGTRLVFSVLYVPVDEFDPHEWPDGRPKDDYYDELIRRLDQVVDDLTEHNSGGKRTLIIKSEKHLDAVLGSDKLVGFAHAVEGGFHLGADLSKIDARVKELADLGVIYITLAHLFPRQVAANAPALPFLPDWLYNRIFPQAPGAGLTDIGVAAVRAMHKHGVLVDISHMREDAIDQTFELLGELDNPPDGKPTKPEEFPVIATHAGYRFTDHQAYMLSPPTIERIAARKGVIGLIMAQHQLNDGLGVRCRAKKSFKRTRQTIRSHIKAIDEHADAFEIVGIGSDLDGFIKPTVGGIENAEDLGKLTDALNEDFPGEADGLLWGNAERVLRAALARRAMPPRGV